MAIVTWLVKPPELRVGTKEYKKFRKWLAENRDWPTNRWLTLKREYLMEYLIDFLNEKP